MPRLSFGVSHALDQEEATRRLKDRFGRLKEKFGQQIHDLEEEWNGDALKFRFKTFGFQIHGTVTLAPSEVKVSAELPFAVMMFKSAIEQQIRDELVKMLA